MLSHDTFCKKIKLKMQKKKKKDTELNLTLQYVRHKEQIKNWTLFIDVTKLAAGILRDRYSNPSNHEKEKTTFNDFLYFLELCKCFLPKKMRKLTKKIYIRKQKKKKKGEKRARYTFIKHSYRLPFTNHISHITTGMWQY